ncbi:uncharacterized protein LOC111122965 [Crassostrea virginica]
MFDTLLKQGQNATKMLPWFGLGIFFTLFVQAQMLANNPVPLPTERCTSGETNLGNGEFFCEDEDCHVIKRCVDGTMVPSSCQEYTDKCVPSPDKTQFTEDPGCKLDFSRVVGKSCSDNDEDNTDDDSEEAEDDEEETSAENDDNDADEIDDDNETKDKNEED